MSRPVHRPDIGRPARQESSENWIEQRNTPFLRDFARLDIVVISADAENVGEMIREIERSRGRARHIWPPPELMPLQADIVVCDYMPGLAERLPWLPGEAPLALVLMCHPDKNQDLKGLTDCAPHGLLWRPVVRGMTVPTLVMARSQALYEQRLRSRIEKLDDNLRTMRSVELAKAILMSAKNMSEEDAYHFLRRQAMERRISIGALASAIVDTKDLLG